MEPTVTTPQLVTPPLDANSFTTPDGITYTATEDISLPRYRALQKWQLQFGFDASFGAVWEATTAIKEAIDQRKSISEIAFVNEGLRRGLTNIDRQHVYQLQVVALWYNAPGEDATSFDLPALTQKMNRWEAAGLGTLFFFAKAAACVRGFREAWLQSTPQQAQEFVSQSPQPI